ncbi:unnamed protein product [Closterium sp. Yama58-4]|nr:unnamed protein product [Closterium sp. Yama58-4]
MHRTLVVTATCLEWCMHILYKHNHDCHVGNAAVDFDWQEVYSALTCVVGCRCFSLYHTLPLSTERRYSSFSPYSRHQEWWDKVQNSPAFRDYWLRERFATLEAEVTESGNRNEEEELVDEQLLEDMVDEELQEELYVLDVDEDFDEILQDSSAEQFQGLLDGRQS